MHEMRARFGIAGAAAAISLAAGTGVAAAPGTVPRECLRARIGGTIACLAPGVRCRPRFERVYRLYGLTCAQDARATYRLRDRLYIGPPTP